mmetsp:Transcript_19722/g.54216  ORF Transcript_19722/g.54216 Transcript_19722/m.54216 type:complete len:502 (-) Transcript_19722:168-1673(-)
MDWYNRRNQCFCTRFKRLVFDEGATKRLAQHALAGDVEGVSDEISGKSTSKTEEQVLTPPACPDHTDSEKGETPLHYACREGHEEVVRTLLRVKVKMEMRMQGGWTPLHLAIKSQSVDVSRQLCEAEADVNSVAEEGETPLHLAMLGKRPDLAHLLLRERGIVIDEVMKGGLTPVIIAAREGYTDLVRALAQKEADLNRAADDKWTAMHLAAFFGHLETIRCLQVEYNAKRTPELPDGEVPLHLAAAGGNFEMAKLLVELRADPSATMKGFTSAMHVAACGGFAEIVKLFCDTCDARADWTSLDRGRDDGATPLFVAAQRGHLETVRTLIAAEAAKEKATHDENTPMHAAALSGHLDVVRYLFEARCQVNCKNESAGVTPLHSAIDIDRPDLVQFLIEVSSEVEVARKDGWLPVHIAAHRNFVPALRLLFQKRAAIDEELGYCGLTPLHVAVHQRHHEAAKFLLEAKANKDHKSKDGWTALVVAEQREYPDMAQILLNAVA